MPNRSGLKGRFRDVPDAQAPDPAIDSLTMPISDRTAEDLELGPTEVCRASQDGAPRARQERSAPASADPEAVVLGQRSGCSTSEEHNQQLDLTAVLKCLVEECPNPGRLMELYYWSDERDLIDVMRQFIALSPPVRAALHGFLMLAKDEPTAVTCEIGESGELTISTPAAAELARRLTDTGEAPILH
jgi:hypothetical protein